MITISDWRQKINQRTQEIIDTRLSMKLGSFPLRDIDLMRSMSGNHICWFYYPYSKYPHEYWELLSLELLGEDDIDVHLSTSVLVSERMGLDVPMNQIPKLWIFSVEIL